MSFGNCKRVGAFFILFKGINVALPAFDDFKSSIATPATCSSSTTICAILPPNATSIAIEYSLSTLPNCTNGACTPLNFAFIIVSTALPKFASSAACFLASIDEIFL